ncbi:hypothetical protein [Parvularcula sp. LCG005]|uniref:hypothetical protein n=1 Tax=Parvularcula sp. LCG005 TaxID=3078805 RepID=UPI002942EAA5|nr:hypothetical protein [Parvularcula sp. LCG005]WOI52987.1 hypothetical protein RUI03_12595 [Parvularcula sp. LCG005]
MKTRALAACLLAGGCAASATGPKFHVVEPEYVAPRAGEVVAQVSPDQIVVYRTKVTDRTPVRCDDLKAEIDRVDAHIRQLQTNWRGAYGLAGQVRGFEMITGTPQQQVANLQPYRNELTRSYKACTQQKRAYEVNPVILASTDPGLPPQAAEHLAGGKFINNVVTFPTADFAELAQGRSCLVLHDYTGKPIPVRTDTSDPYRFANPYANTYLTAAQAVARDEDIASRLYNVEKRIGDLRYSLQFNKANMGGSCKMPEQRAIPPRPKNVMSAEEVEYQATAACVDQIYTRFSQSEGSEVFTRRGRYEEIEMWDRWHKNGDYKKACGLNQITDEEAFEAGARAKLQSLVIGRVAFVREVDELYGKCLSRATNACNAKQSEWERERDAIIAEPRRAYSDCTQMQAELKELTEKLPIFQSAAEATQENRQRSLNALYSQGDGYADAAALRCGASENIMANATP